MIDGIRIPPHSAEAERGVLGSVLLDPTSLEKVPDLQSDAFYDRRHSALFEEMRALRDTNKPFDAISLGDWLSKRGSLDRIGGYDYLIELQEETLVTAHVRSYAVIIQEKRRLRRIIEESMLAADKCYSSEDADSVVSSLTTSVVSLRSRDIETTTTDDIIEAYRGSANGSTRCIPTPFDGLTMRTGGPMRGMETLLTGRSKSGKSMLKSFWHQYLGSIGIPALDCPYEDGEFIARSRCASIGSYSAGRLIRGGSYIKYNDEWKWDKVRPDEIAVAERSLRRQDELPMFWDEERVTPDRLKSKLAFYAEKHGVQAVFLDGAKDITRPSGSHNDTGFDEEISCAVVSAARELDIAIISVYHLTKLAQDELIKSTNIRGSGNIVSNSRLVYALQGDKDGAGLAEYSNSKPLDYDSDGYCQTRVFECIDNNHGELGKVWLNADLGLCSFSQMR